MATKPSYYSVSRQRVAKVVEESADAHEGLFIRLPEALRKMAQGNRGAYIVAAHGHFAGCGLGYDGSIRNFGRFMRLSVHTRRCGVLPQSANRTMASPIPKSGAAKRGPESLRVIHVLSLSGAAGAGLPFVGGLL